VILARDHALFSGDTALLAQLWSDSDTSILADGSGGAYNSLQFMASLRYFNASGNGLLSFAANGSCGGSWACEPLVDWPTGTRDGYDCGPDNREDTVRSALSALAYGALADVARWLSRPAAAARYDAMAAGVRAALRRLNLRGGAGGDGDRDGGGGGGGASGGASAAAAFFVDGAVGASASHAAVHSTLYAISAGAADGDAVLGAALAAFLRRHGVAPSSCMMGRWWVTGLLRLGVFSAEAADLALDVLTAPGYPSWLDMIAQGATTTMEAWRPEDKSNLDWAHPWCASPAFTVPGGVLGAAPLAPGWARFRVWPQASDLAAISAAVPTPAGMVELAYTAAWSSPGGGSGGSAGSANATLALTVLAGQAAQVCLAVPGRAAQAAAAAAAAASDTLIVDGAPAESVAEGRFLCAAADLAPGAHTVARVVEVAA
jgi:alpha-L-rhamnosidase